MIPAWRCIDVEPTLYKRHVPAGMAHFEDKSWSEDYLIMLMR